MILHKRWLQLVLGLSVLALSNAMLVFSGGNYIPSGCPDEGSKSEQVSVAPGMLDDETHLLDQATISLEAVTLAPLGAGDGSVAEVDLPGRPSLQRGHWQRRYKGCCLQWNHSRPRIRNR